MSSGIAAAPRIGRRTGAAPFAFPVVASLTMRWRSFAPFAA
ncbi:hypothetical protein [Burkholderia glumae]|nr:hypothetical protein [Burkholderia glumae]